jgi:hypothetical protein
MREDQNVWTSLLLELRNLRMVRDVGRAADFARGLMKKQPSAFRSREGLFFLAWNHKYLPADLSERCLRIWRAGDWEGRDQAIGEFALLRSLQAADDRYSSRIVSNALSARASPARQGVRIGVAFAAVNLWREPEHRDACHQVIVRLFPLADDELSRVLMDVFRVTDPMPPDRYTVDLLNRVMLEPKMLTCHSMLAHRLRRLLADGVDPLLVARVSNAILDTAGQAMGNFRSRWAGDSGHLMQIAMTLQKIDASRDAGLELFERLMELGAYEADQVLREVDRRLK